MKSSRLALTIISIVANILAGVIFILPVWYFANSITVNDTISTLTTDTLNIFDFEKLNEINKIYNNHNESLDQTIPNIFIGGTILTMILSLTLIAISLLNTIQSLKTFNKLNKVCRIFSIMTCACAILTLVIGIVFSGLSAIEIVHTENTIYSLSINISSGIYLFTIFEISGAVCGYIANNVKENIN